jgi:hypothetical protein
MDERYLTRRCQLEAAFVPENRLPDSEKTVVSPSGLYELKTCSYSSVEPDTLGCCRGTVRRLSDQKIIADVKRNLPGFWYEWVEHANGCEYLLCGEDYQGYSVVNLTKEDYHVFFPERGYDGRGFCWAQVMPSPDKLTLAVYGCFWAAPYDVRFIDFREPDLLPLPELGVVEGVEDGGRWVSNNTYSMKCEIEVRKSDKAPYDSLSEAEQDALDAAKDLTEYVLVTETFTRPDPTDSRARRLGDAVDARERE